MALRRQRCSLISLEKPLLEPYLCQLPCGRVTYAVALQDAGHRSRERGGACQWKGGKLTASRPGEISIFKTSELRAGLLWKRALEVDRAGGPGKGQCPGKMKSKGMTLPIRTEMPVALSFPFLYGVLIKSKDISTAVSGMRCPCAGEHEAQWNSTVSSHQRGPDHSKPQGKSPGSWWERWPWRAWKRHSKARPEGQDNHVEGDKTTP